MKKSMITLLVTFLILCSLLAEVFATDIPSTITVSSKSTVVMDDEITFTVAVAGSIQGQALLIEPVYDDHYFQLVSGEWIMDGGEIKNFDISCGDGVIAFNDDTEFSGKILTFTLKAISTEAKENLSVGCNVVLQKKDGTKPEVVVSPTSVSIVSCMYGDLSGDGTIDTMDLTLLRKYLAGYTVTGSLDAADLNGDGRVDTIDLTLLRKYLAGYDIGL